MGNMSISLDVVAGVVTLALLGKLFWLAFRESYVAGIDGMVDWSNGRNPFEKRSLIGQKLARRA